MNSFKSLSIAIISCFLLVFISCEVDQEVPIENLVEQQAVPKDIIQKLEKAGFHTNDGLSKVEGGYLVEGDIFFTEDMIHELSEENTENSKQYRTRNLVSGTRTIRVYVAPALGTFVRNSVDQALSRYNALNLRLTFSRTSNASSYDIRIIPAGPNVLGSAFAAANFPRNGRPHNTIQMNTLFYGGSNRLGNTVSIIAHEIGHCIGFRHTDYANRAFSCGGDFSPENVEPNGAIHIPGTPTTNAVANSWMLACWGANTNRPFIASDRTALLRLYPKETTPPTNGAIPFYRYFNGKDHYYTTNFRELGTGAGGYRYEGVECKVFNRRVSGTVPFYQYKSPAGDHFYTTNRREGDASGLTYQRIAAYIYPSGGRGRITLYRYFNGLDHFYTVTRRGYSGYTYEGPAGYVLPR